MTTQEDEMNQRTREGLDDNKEILELLKGRLDLGRSRYGHGVLIDDDITKYGPEHDDWELMALEEALDGMIYSAAAMIRLQRHKREKKLNIQ